jgi:hypothetical protein
MFKVGKCKKSLIEQTEIYFLFFLISCSLGFFHIQYLKTPYISAK